jgi:hypothetical protein
MHRERRQAAAIPPGVGEIPTAVQIATATVVLRLAKVVPAANI